MKRIISCLLCLTFVWAALPLGALKAFAAGLEPYTMDDGYIEVQVSKQNAGFIVNTVEGDSLKKSDNNKNLLFHDGEYDTSFVSYRVKYGDGREEDYLFGGKYGDSSDPSHLGVSVIQDQPNGSVVATWSVGDLTFLQSISLENEDSDQHGMISIQLLVQNRSGSPVEVKARLLLDTCLGDQDFAYHQADKENGPSEIITSEKILEGNTIPLNFFATDNPHDPGIIAYSVNSPSNMPYQVAFGHWNNLASSLFDFTPDGTLAFTNPYNDYLTADSAYALYYNLDSVDHGESKGLITYYGVYSRHNVTAANSVAVDAIAPLRLELNDSKEQYLRLTEVGIADFAVGVTFENFDSDTAKPLKNVVLSVQTTANIRSLGDSGVEMEGYEFGSFKPLNISYADVQVGIPISKSLYFEAKTSDQAAYERITIGVYDVNATGGEVAAEHLLGEKVVYILLPGSDGDIPKVHFVSMTPDIIYSSGTRHLFLTVNNSAMLSVPAHWNLKAYTVDKKHSVDIPSSLVSIKDGVMDIALTNEIKLAPGSWFLQLEWTDAALSAEIVPPELQKQTGPELHFVVSENPKYKNDSYGVLCVVEYDYRHYPATRTETFGGLPAYRIEAFEDEDAFKEFQEDTNHYLEILLIIRGEFTADKYVADNDLHKEYTYYSAISTKTMDSDREYKVDNTITVNGCMDFEGGTMLVYYENYSVPEKYKEADINVEFDGELLTSDARTSVWKGKAILTKISQGEQFSLRPYDSDGERGGDFNHETIRLVWPSIYGAGQTLAGMIFKLAYGELGVMYDDDGEEIGRVLSFSASLSLNFLKSVPDDDPKVTYWSKVQDIYRYYDTSADLRKFLYSADDVNNLWDFDDVDESGEEKKGVTASVMVEDILFGCGKGFVGLHFKVEIGVKNFIDSLPEITGELEVNTIGNYSFGFEGSMELPTMQMEARLKFRSKNDIPVPDEIYFYVGGFKPGINIDAGGVLWITGGGGGISNIYDTIFLTQAIPPLKLLLSVSFSIIQVMDGRANVALGLTGISLEAEDLKILGALEAIEKIYLGLEWYPDFDLQASISVDFFNGVIKGGGYIVLFSKAYSDFFFEIYIFANLSIPESFPAVGGMELLGVDLGANNDKIWGGFKVLGIGYGVTYFWGQDGVEFTTGGTMAQPTFPDLLGQEDIPVYYDEERDQTLYARFGTNVTLIGSAKVVESPALPRLLALELRTDPDTNSHMFNLGEYNASTNNAAIVQISYDASSLEDARTLAQAFTAKDGADADFPLTFYDGTNVDTANANVTYNSTSGRASCCFTVTDPGHYDMEWYISTGDVPSTVMLYNVGVLPEVETVTGAVTGGNIDLQWSGIALGDLDKLSFYLTGSKDKGDPETLKSAEGGIALTVLDQAADITAGSISVPIPADTPTGEYYVRAVYSKEDQVNGMIFSDGKVTYNNSDMPDGLTIRGFAPAGNLEYRLTIAEPTDGKTKGYKVTIYNADGSPTDVANLTYPKSDTGDTVFTIGGSYEYENVNYGLTGGETYRAGVTPYNLISTSGSGEYDTVIYGEEVLTSLVLLPAQTTPTVTISADKLDQSGTFTENEVTFTASVSEVSSGKWALDDTVGLWIPDDTVARIPDDLFSAEAFKGEFTDTSEILIPLTNIGEGDHILTIWGRDADGDGFKHDHDFSVDTMPPRLMLTSPVNGSLFNKDGSLSVSGVTDAGVGFTICSDGSTVHDKVKIEDLGGSIDREGVFQFDIDIPSPHDASRHDLVISVSDAVGNTVSKSVWVSHGGLADLDRVEVLIDGQSPGNGHIPEDMLGGPRQLSLIGITSDGPSIQLSNASNVSWQCMALEGSAQVCEDGVLTLSPDAMGMVIGKLEVATGAYRTGVLSFGAEAPAGTVIATHTTGGTVSGGGEYVPGRLVVLRAIPGSGYSFAGWTLTGIFVQDTGLSTITFVMPSSSDVTAHAEFVARPGGGGGAYEYDPITPITNVTVQKGDIVEVDIPPGVDPNTFVAYCRDENGNKTFVPLSAIVDGKLRFEAPIDATYYFVDNRIGFRDTIEHWAEPTIGFMTARGLFRGIGDNLFAPDMPMTRAMLVAVLHRLAGEPEAEQLAAFTDVAPDAWYAASVAWGYETGITLGMGDRTFDPDAELTREQMCAFIVRFIRMNGLDLSALLADGSFLDATDISDWAEEDIAYCQSMGFVEGYPDGRFLPQGKATRAENCTVLMRLIEAMVGELSR